MRENDEHTGEHERGTAERERVGHEVGHEVVESEREQDVDGAQDGDVVGVFARDRQREAHVADEPDGAGEERQRDVVEDETLGEFGERCGRREHGRAHVEKDRHGNRESQTNERVVEDDHDKVNVLLGEFFDEHERRAG